MKNSRKHRGTKATTKHRIDPRDNFAVIRVDGHCANACYSRVQIFVFAGYRTFSQPIHPLPPPRFIPSVTSVQTVCQLDIKIEPRTYNIFAFSRIEIDPQRADDFATERVKAHLLPRIRYFAKLLFYKVFHRAHLTVSMA